MTLTLGLTLRKSFGLSKRLGSERNKSNLIPISGYSFFMVKTDDGSVSYLATRTDNNQTSIIQGKI